MLRQDAGIVWRQWRLSLGLGVVIAAAAAGASTGATRAQAAPAIADAASPAGTAVRLAEPPPTLAAPADGRLNGYGFTGTVLGVATARKVDGQSAGTGLQWWVVGMRWQVTAVSPPAAVSLAVVADGQTTLLPLPAGAATSPDTGPLYWAVSEPTAAPDITLQASSQDVTQSFSLGHLDRTGPAPAVLYRTPGQWRTVVAVNKTVTRTIPYFDGEPGGGLAIDLQAVTVTDFGPAGPNDTPPPGAGAWLTLTIASSNNPDASTGFYNGLAANQITLTVPGHPPADATITPGGGLDTNSAGSSPAATRSASPPGSPPPPSPSPRHISPSATSPRPSPPSTSPPPRLPSPYPPRPPRPSRPSSPWTPAITTRSAPAHPGRRRPQPPAPPARRTPRDPRRYCSPCSG